MSAALQALLEEHDRCMAQLNRIARQIAAETARIEALARVPMAPTVPADGRLLTVAEAAECLGVCTKKVRQLIQRGELPRSNVDGAVRVEESAVAAYRARAQRQGAEHLGFAPKNDAGDPMGVASPGRPLVTGKSDPPSVYHTAGRNGRSRA